MNENIVELKQAIEDMAEALQSAIVENNKIAEIILLELSGIRSLMLRMQTETLKQNNDIKDLD